MKINKLLVSVLTIFISLILLVSFFFVREINREPGYQIIIKNTTNEEIEGLWIDYGTGSTKILVSNIRAGEKQRVFVTTEKILGEGILALNYKDMFGELHTDTVIGYIERGYSGEAQIEILSKDSSSGELIISVKEN